MMAIFIIDHQETLQALQDQLLGYLYLFRNLKDSVFFRNCVHRGEAVAVGIGKIGQGNIRVFFPTVSGKPIKKLPLLCCRRQL